MIKWIKEHKFEIGSISMLFLSIVTFIVGISALNDFYKQFNNNIKGCLEARNKQAEAICLKNTNSPEFKIVDEVLFCNVDNAPKEFFSDFSMSDCMDGK
jgi:hypothetical protein